MSTNWECLARQSGGTVAGFAVGGTLIFAATPVGVFRSADGGRSWTLPGVSSSVAFADMVIASPRFASDQILFACGADGLYRSSDAGETWQQLLSGGRMLSVAASTAENQNDLIVLAGSDKDGVLRSEDGGRSWTGANAGLLDLTATSLALSPCFATDRTGFTGTPSGVYRTRNGGRSWRVVDTRLDEPAVQCVAASPDFAADRLVLAGTETDGVLRSDDGGTTWSRPASLAEGGVAALAFGPSPEVIAASCDQGIAFSTDGGETWTVRASEPRDPVLALAFAGDVLLAGLHRNGVNRSADAGVTWNTANNGLCARLDTEVLISPDGTLLVGGLEDGLRSSRDGGVTWTPRIEASVSALALSGAAIYAATESGIHLSRDRGTTWQPWPVWPTPFEGTEVIALAVHDDRTFFVATFHAGELVVWRSIDSGERWQRWFVQSGGARGRVALAVSPTHLVDSSAFIGIGAQVFSPLRHAEEVRAGERRPMWRASRLGQAHLNITALAVSPAYAADHTVFAATSGGIFVSHDLGERFVEWNDGLDQPRMVSVAVSPNYQIDRLVYALALGGAVWRRHADPR